MSRNARSHPRRPLVMPALILIGLAASAATAQAQSPGPERALLNRTPAAMFHLVGAANQSPASIDVAGNVGVNRVRGCGTFSTPFSGVAANGKDLMWSGAAGGGVPGEMLILLADKGLAVESNRPVWEVEGIVFVSGAPEESFAADVDGTIDWKQGTMVLRGRITAGRLNGAAFEQTAELQQFDLRGQWRAERVLAAK
jgi:hypothetical protein